MSDAKNNPLEEAVDLRGPTKQRRKAKKQKQTDG